jgi:cation diffusion facilitator CzcD-associated flavoprotein CzcO
MSRRAALADRGVLIVGAGVTGLGAAYHLGAADIPYTILEAGEDVGGVWHTHRWHGARCDSEFIKYSFSFKPFLSPLSLQPRAQIHRYLGAVADEFRIRGRIRFNTRVTRAVFDPAECRWIVHTTAGIFTSRFLLNGNGYFSDPHVPSFRGAQTFKGEILHTAELDERRTFHDKDVVLVGSGATAVCAAPELARVSRSLVLVQRSPSYIYETCNQAGIVTRVCQQLHARNVTTPVKVLRYAIQCKDDLVFVVFRRFPRLARWFFEHHWRRTIDEGTPRRHFQPRYDPWEQRIAVAVGLKDQIRRRALTIRTGEIERFTDSSIVMADGDTIRCDVCILATGYDLELLKFQMYVGAEPITAGGLNLYKNIMLGGVPNYFHPFGAWHTAWTQNSETVTRFAITIMRHMRAHGYDTVRVARRSVHFVPPLSSGYITRSLSRMPRFHGTYGLPTLDNVLSYRFTPRDFIFA